MVEGHSSSFHHPPSFTSLLVIWKRGLPVLSSKETFVEPLAKRFDYLVRRLRSEKDCS